MRKLLAFSGVFLIFGSVATGQQGASYTVRFKPLAIINEENREVIVKVPKRKTILLRSYNQQCDCFLAKYGEFEGIITSRSWIEDIYSGPVKKSSRYELSDSVKRLLTEYRLANDKEPDEVFTLAKSTRGETDFAKTMDIISRWGYTNGKRIAEGKIWPGMSVEMALESWGIPYRVNITRGSWGIREQWIYSEAYLYFENGTLAEIFRLNKNVD